MRTPRITLLALHVALLASACAGASGSTPPAGVASAPRAPVDPWPTSGRVDGPQAKELVRRGAILLDVRSADSFEWEKLPGAVNLPLEELEVAKELFAPLTTPIVVYCTAGITSAQAFRQLQAMGFTHVYDLGPMSGWR